MAVRRPAARVAARFMGCHSNMNSLACCRRGQATNVIDSMVPTSKRKEAPNLVVLPGGATAGLTDEDIVEAVRRGDRACADQLYFRLVDAVDITLFRIFGRRETDHEDLVQRSFEQIVLTLSRRTFAGACSLRTWASAI